MKFLAVLRDSVREAMDAKVIYVLLIGSALVILGAFSISFKALPDSEGLKTILGRLPGATTFGGPPPVTYTAEDFEQTNPGKPAWEGDYRYTLVVTDAEPPAPPEEGENGEVKKKKKPVKQPSPFRLIVLLTLVQNKDTAELSAEDRETRERIRQMQADIIRSGGKFTRKQMEQMNETFSREVERITDRQLERFLKKQLAASGTLEVTEVKFVSYKNREYRFQVESKARPETYRTWPHEMKLAFGALTWPTNVSVGGVVYYIEDWLVAGVGASIAMLLGTIITAFFIPNMLRKGTIDLLIAKPIHRWTLLVYKYIGGLSFMFIPTAAIVVGIWLALGLRSGLWGSNFLLTILVLVFQFAIFYAISTLLGVLTRSPIICILLCCLSWGVLWGVPAVQGMVRPFHQLEVTPAWVYNSLDVTRKALPRYKDLDALNSQLIAKDLLPQDDNLRKSIDDGVAKIDWGQSLAVTLAYIGLMLGLGCWWFATRDY
jgi:hypothetical protein